MLLMGDSSVRGGCPAHYRAPMTSPKIAASLLAAALLVALAGCGDTAEPTTPVAASPSPTATLAAVRDPIMCEAIARAVTVWDSQAPKDATDVLTLSGSDMAEAMQGSDTLLAAVEGHDDPNSKILALAVAEYGFVLANANLILTNTGKLDDGRAEQVASKAAAIRSTHANLQGISCSGA